MKYIFFGTPRFAAIVLDKLIEADLLPVAVVCNPDRPVGRKHEVTPPSIKQLVSERNAPIDILQPEKLDKNFLERLRSYEAEVFVVAAYAKILRQDVLSIPPKGVVGVHPSLLPKLRGATPIQSAILQGLNETGVTLFLIDEEVDHGPILSQQKVVCVGDEKYLELEEKLAEVAGVLLAKTLPLYVRGEVTPLPQNDTEATFTAKFGTKDAYIQPSELEAALRGDNTSAELILRKIRAFDPEPGAFTEINGKRTKLFDAEIRNGALNLTEIQVAGKKRQKLS